MGLHDLLSTASCAASTSTMSGDGTYIDNDTLSTAISTTASYLSTCPHDVRMMHTAEDYMNSMSIVQLEEFEQQLDRELELVFSQEENIEQPKVYTK